MRNLILSLFGALIAVMMAIDEISIPKEQLVVALTKRQVQIVQAHYNTTDPPSNVHFDGGYVVVGKDDMTVVLLRNGVDYASIHLSLKSFTEVLLPGFMY